MPDPKPIDMDVLLTTAALGEPMTKAEQAALDAELVDNPRVALEIDRRRRTAEELRHVLHGEADLLPIPEGPATYTPRSEPAVHKTPEETPIQHPAWPAILAMAAALTLTLGLAWLVLQPVDDARQLATVGVAEEADEAAAFTDGVPNRENLPATDPLRLQSQMPAVAWERADSVLVPAEGETVASAAQREAAGIDAIGGTTLRYEIRGAIRAPLIAPADSPAPASAMQRRRRSDVTNMRGLGPNVATNSAAFTNGQLGQGIAGNVANEPGGFGGGGGFADDLALGDTLEAERAEAFNREAYDRIIDNPFRRAVDEPLSTFSIDVDTASYANVRRFLNDGNLPPADAVRIEELVNYFPYDYKAPGDEATPFAANLAVVAAPWNERHKLVRIGLKGREIDRSTRPAANLVFLLDVSGSMNQPNKLPLVKKAMRTLLGSLRPDDRVAIVVYAGASGLVLDSTAVEEAKQITAALDRLSAGGGTNGGEGIELAYDVAQNHFIDGGVNRVILATDGDFNVGTTSRGELTRLIEAKAESGVYLTILGFGTGNVQDATMEELSNVGEGNYAYIDTEREAEKVLGEQVGGTLVAIAKDVKLQVDFNPAKVLAYRLIGFENRVLANQDFNDDTKDAGDLGAGHEVTAFYEIIPAEMNMAEAQQALLEIELKLRQLGDAVAAGQPMPGLARRQEALIAERDLLRAAAAMVPPAVENSIYVRPQVVEGPADELLTVRLRYKAPDAPKEQGTSQLLRFPLKDADVAFADADADFRFAAAVAGWGMVLRDSPHRGGIDATWAANTAAAALGDDPGGYRAEAIELMKQSAALAE
jgi:Mg-chelatase subunit ChlD